MADINNLIVKATPQPPSKFIIMGEPMSGKTTLASKAPKPLFISTDGNAAKAGLDAVNADSLATVRDAINYFEKSKDYDTLIIDTIEGIADLFEKTVIDKFNQQGGINGQPITALNDVAFGKLTGQFNKRVAAFSETLWLLQKNVIVLSYTKRRIDDLSGSIVLDSELKNIRLFTKFADAVMLTSYDGEKYRAQVVSKRTVMAGKVEFGPIEDFLRAGGWDMPTRKTKVGTAKK
jgi:hypothetical protein